MNYKDQYGKQRNQAKYRGIEWQFDYETWVEWWGEDITKRGRTADSLVMSRYEDKGPYSPENCKKQTQSENAKEIQRLQGKEIARKISEANKGKTPWNKGVTGEQVAWNKGLKLPQTSGWNSKSSRGVKTPFGDFATQREASQALGVSEKVIWGRLKRMEDGYEYIVKSSN